MGDASENKFLNKTFWKSSNIIFIGPSVITNGFMMNRLLKFNRFTAACLFLGIVLNGFYLFQIKPEAPLTKLCFGTETIIGQYPGCDFYALYFPAKNIISQRPLYAPPAKEDFRTYSAYRYAPVGILAGIPFAFFSPEIAFLLWVIFIEALLVMQLLLLFRLTKNQIIRGLGTLSLFGSYPVFLELFTGQFSVLQGTFIFAALVFWHEGAKWKFDLFWFFSLIWKLNTWITLPPLIVKRQWKSLAAAFIILVLTSLPVFYFYPEAWRAFAKMNFAGAGQNTSIMPSNLSTVALLTAFFPHTEIKTLIYIIAASVAGVTTALTLFYRRVDLAFHLCLWFSSYFIIYKHIWKNHYLMLLPVIFFMASKFPAKRWLIPGLLIFLPGPYVFVESWGFLNRVLYHSFVLLPGLLTYIFIALAMVKARAKPMS